MPLHLQNAHCGLATCIGQNRMVLHNVDGNRIGWRMERRLSKSKVYCVAAYYIFHIFSNGLLTSSLTPGVYCLICQHRG